MPSRSRNNQWFALPAPPPPTLTVGGVGYRLARVFKHDFFAATCLYEACADARFARIVVKFGRVQGFCGLGLQWYGRWLAVHEQDIYAALEGVRGVPAWVGRIGPTGYALEYLDARPLDHLDQPPPGFFDRLREVFEAIHARGIAYADSNKRSNILVGPAGEPYVIDFQIALRRRDDWPWPLRAVLARVVAYIAAKDIYHLCKHKRRLAPQELTAQEDQLSRRRGGLHALHRRLSKKWRNLRRTFLSRQHAKGALESPTADLEDHRQPEKETWRTPKAP